MEFKNSMGPSHCTLALLQYAEKEEALRASIFQMVKVVFIQIRRLNPGNQPSDRGGVDQSEACFSPRQEVLVLGTVKMSFSDKAALMLV